MLDAPPLGVNHSPKNVKAALKQQIQARDENGFSVVDENDGTKHPSHTPRFERGRYPVWCAATGQDFEDGSPP